MPSRSGTGRSSLGRGGPRPFAVRPAATYARRPL